MEEITPEQFVEEITNGNVTINGVLYTNVVLRYTISSKVWTFRSYPTQFLASSKYNDGTIIYNLKEDIMGTNYYIKAKECKHCGRYEEIHLGKASRGWQFSFRYNGGKYYKNIEEMKKWLKGKQIRDEYGEKVSYNYFWEMIEVKRKGFNHTDKCPEDKSSFNIDGYSFTDCEFC